MKWFGMPPTAPERVADRTHVEMKIVKKYPLFYIFCYHLLSFKSASNFNNCSKNPGFGLMSLLFLMVTRASSKLRPLTMIVY